MQDNPCNSKPSDKPIFSAVLDFLTGAGRVVNFYDLPIGYHASIESLKKSGYIEVSRTGTIYICHKAALERDKRRYIRAYAYDGAGHDERAYGDYLTSLQMEGYE